MNRPRVVVAGIGNELRHDDGVGPAVVDRVRHMADPPVALLWRGADPLELIGVWSACKLAVIVDATRSGLAPGSVRVLELDHDTDVAAGSTVPGSTHALGLAMVLRLGDALGSLPGRVVLVGVEGSDFEPGPGLTPAVAAAVEDAAHRVLELTSGAATCA
jgi:hydrogenase maturation protease